MRAFSAVIALSSLFLPALATGAETQTAAMGPPKVLQIGREQVKPGKNALHEKVEASWPLLFANAHWPTHWLGMTSLTGPNEAWFVVGFDSLAAWEKDNRDMEKTPALKTQSDQLSQKDGELLSGTNSIAAVYNEEFSYRPNVKLGEMRYFAVVTLHVRPGHDNDFTEARKLAKAAHEKANMDEHWAYYQVISGAPTGTYLIFAPMKSLKEADAYPSLHGKAYKDALGEEGQKKMRELESTAILSSETNLFEFKPKMSYVSKETAAADPAFWMPKSESPKASIQKKGSATPVSIERK
jgi:hypothetical protein